MPAKWIPVINYIFVISSKRTYQDQHLVLFELKIESHGLLFVAPSLLILQYVICLMSNDHNFPNTPRKDAEFADI